ncbi:MAG: AsmA family protein [Desulfuromonadaceae bacterium]|nr:AsmA family protein [Desulfuromonadaceae bacterium]
MKKRFSFTRLMLFLLLLTFGAGAAAFIYVSRVDLQPYFQEELSKALGRPVTINEVRLRFVPMPALDFKDIAIESPGDLVAAIHVPHLHLQPAILPLLRGQLLFNKITLQSPSLRIDLANLGQGEKSVDPEGKNATGAIRLEILRLRQGNVTLVHSGDNRFPTPVIFPNVNGRLVMKRDQPRILMIDGEISREESLVPFSGEVSWADNDSWRQEMVTARFLLSRLPASVLTRLIPQGDPGRATGNLDLSLKARGRPVDGVEVSLKLTGENAAISSAILEPNPLPIKVATLQTLWTSSSERELFADLSMQFEGPVLTGAAELAKRQEGLWLKADLASPPLTLAELPLAAAKTLPIRGRMELKSCQFDGPAAALQTLLHDFSPLRAELQFSEIEGQLPGAGKLEKGTAILRLEGNRLRLEEGRFLLDNDAGEISAVLDDLFRKGLPLKLQARGALPLAPLLSAIPAERRKGLAAKGSFPFHAQGGGSGESFKVHLDGDLAGLVKPFSDLGILAAETPATLALTFDLNRQAWLLEKGSVICGAVTLQASGDGKINDPRDFRLRFNVPALPLDKLAGTLPKLQRWKLRGRAFLTASLSGTREGPPHFNGELRLAEAGLHIIPMLADLNGINGSFLITPQGITTDKVTGLLGQSPLQIVAASLEDFSSPVLTLHVQGQKVRADELIFPSDQAFLYDLDGRLRIDRHELRFEKVDVSLAQGTRATVRGHVRNFREPETWLHITSREAVIDEVIALWQRSVPKAKQPPRRKEVGLLIDMEVAKGVIDGFHFNNAVGQLRLKNGKIIIHPLDFHAGPGYGVGQVIVDPRPAGPAQLRISGHVENLDAATVSRQVLSAESIATGSLSGDFYLECRAEKGFLASSQGKFNGEIRNGVLKEFKTLAKVFSLLNVSQLFSMKLPDMSREGMPFDRISATADLNQGILTSENLLVDSTSMKLSLVGNLDLKNDRIDAVMGIRPLGTVDTVMSRIPIAGWILGGEEKALITAHFQFSGNRANPTVDAIPVSSLSDKALGIFRRILQLPGKMITNPRELIGGPEKTGR